MSDLQDFHTALERVQAGLIAVAEKFARKASHRIAVRSISSHMKRGGPNPGRRNPGDPLRIVTGRLSRSLASRGRLEDTGGQPEGIMEIDVAQNMVTLVKGTKVPYAPVHEYGFSGSVSIPGHTRRITQAFGRSISPRDVSVRAHTRNMTIAQRAFLEPALQDELPTLRKMAEADLYEFVLKTVKS